MISSALIAKGVSYTRSSPSLQCTLFENSSTSCNNADDYKDKRTLYPSYHLSSSREYFPASRSSHHHLHVFLRIEFFRGRDKVTSLQNTRIQRSRNRLPFDVHVIYLQSPPQCASSLILPCPALPCLAGWAIIIRCRL